MSADATTWVLIGALACFGAATVGGLALQNALLSREPASSRPAVVMPRRTSWVCDEPPVRFNIAQAHRAMQIHRDHLLDECPRKRAAFRVLVEEGHATPDTGRIRVHA